MAAMRILSTSLLLSYASRAFAQSASPYFIFPPDGSNVTFPDGTWLDAAWTLNGTSDSAWDTFTLYFWQSTRDGDNQNFTWIVENATYVNSLQLQLNTTAYQVNNTLDEGLPGDVFFLEMCPGPVSTFGSDCFDSPTFSIVAPGRAESTARVSSIKAATTVPPPTFVLPYVTFTGDVSPSSTSGRASSTPASASHTASSSTTASITYIGEPSSVYSSTSTSTSSAPTSASPIPTSDYALSSTSSAAAATTTSTKSSLATSAKAGVGAGLGLGGLYAPVALGCCLLVV